MLSCLLSDLLNLPAKLLTNLPTNLRVTHLPTFCYSPAFTTVTCFYGTHLQARSPAFWARLRELTEQHHSLLAFGLEGSFHRRAYTSHNILEYLPTYFDKLLTYLLASGL